MNKNIILAGPPIVLLAIVAVGAVAFAVKSENNLGLARAELSVARNEAEKARTDRLLNAAQASNAMENAERMRVASLEQATRERDEVRLQLVAKEAENDFAKKEIAALRKVMDRQQQDHDAFAADMKRDMDIMIARHRTELDAERAGANRTVAEANNRVVAANNAAYLAQQHAAAQPTVITVNNPTPVLVERAYERPGVVVIGRPVVVHRQPCPAVNLSTADVAVRVVSERAPSMPRGRL